MYEMGRAVVEALLASMAGEGLPPAVFSPELIVRASTAGARPPAV